MEYFEVELSQFQNWQYLDLERNMRGEQKIAFLFISCVA